jgi:uncharacterized protein (TIGR02996 family)
VFLQDIRDCPDDEGVRLILADWLEDHGDESDQARSELIRLQCALSRAGKLAPRVRRRAEKLIATWADDWLGPLFSLAQGWSFERGRLHLTLRAITCFDPRVEEVSRTEAYAWTESLTVVEATPGTIGQLVQHPLVAPLRELSFVESRVGDNGLELLARAEGLCHLRKLGLAYCSVGGRGLSALRVVEALPALESLDLSQNHLNDADLVPLLLSASPPRLRELHLAHNNLHNGAACLLAQSPLMNFLEVLDLRANRSLGAGGIVHLVGHANASRLRSLNLSQTQPGPGGAAALLSSPHLPRLEELYLDRCDLRDEVAKAFLLSPGLPNLNTIGLGRNFLGDEAAIALAVGHPRPWRRIQLSGNYIGPDGAEALANSAHLSGLEEFCLGGNVLTDQGAQHLVWSPYLDKLTLLNLSDNALSPGGQAALLRRFGREVVLL